MSHPSFIRNLLVFSSLLSLSPLIQGCATSHPVQPAIIQIDRQFVASEMDMDDLHDTVSDIKTRHDGGSITILVRYVLHAPYSASADLAYTQGETVRDFLQQQDIDAPMQIIISPIASTTNRIWISYRADGNKGDGIYLQGPVSDTEQVIEQEQEQEQKTNPDI